MKKITFLLLHLNYGGLEKQVVTLANNLVDEYQVEFIVLYDLLKGKSFYNLNDKVKVKFILPSGPIRAGKIKEYLKGFKFIKLLKSIAFDIKLICKKYFGFKKIIKNLDTDILISSRIEFAKQIRRKDIITISQEHSYIDDKKYMLKTRKAFKNVKYLVVMTNKAKELYDSYLKGYNKYTNVLVIPNMINENKDNNLSNLSNNQIVSVGRLEDVKDFETLIHVFNMIHIKNNEVNLKIIGEGSKRESLEKLIKLYNLGKYVTLTGQLTEEEINDELLKSDIFISTSKSESFSLVICEAMNYGLPCISFDIDARS